MRLVGLSSSILIFIFSFCFAEENFVLSGYIHDIKTGSPISNVNIYNQKHGIGTVSDKNGYYNLNFPEPGKYLLIFKSIEHKTEYKSVFISSENKPLDIELRPGIIEFKGVVVEGTKEMSLHNDVKITSKSLKNNPALGEPDIIAAIRTLPGIYMTNDLKGGFYVRGGSPDQNMIMLDGCEVVNPFHVLGLFSTFNIWAMEDVQVYPANFPVNYSGKLSSAIDIASKEPKKNTEFNANVSLVSSAFAWSKAWNKRSLLIGYRNTYIDKFTYILGITFPYSFYDANIKYTENLSEAVSLQFNYFENRDRFVMGYDNEDESQHDKMKWGNELYNANLSKKFTNGLLKFSLAQNSNLFRLSGNDYIDNQIKYQKATIDINYKMNNHIFSSGFEYRKDILDYEWNTSIVDEIFYEEALEVFENQYNKETYSVYFADKINIVNKFYINPGLRTDFINSNYYFSPRLSLSWNRNVNSKIKLNIGRYYQSFSQGAIGKEGTLISPTFPNKKISFCDSYSASYFFKIGQIYDFRIETFIRDFKNLALMKKDNFPDFEYSSGNAYGIDFMLSKSAGFFTYQLSYAFQRTYNYFSGIKAPADWDTPHVFTGIFGFNFFKEWFLNSQIVYRTGLPYTPTIGKYNSLGSIFYGNSGVRFVEGEINSARYSDYFRWDISLRKKYYKKNYNYVVYVQVINVLNRKNTLRYDWEQYWDYYDNENAIGENGSLPIIPSLGVEFEFK